MVLGFPFAQGGPRFVNGQKWLGGEIHIIPAGAAAPNRSIQHTLGRVPRAFLILDVGTNAALSTPFPRGSTAWAFSTFSLNTPLLTAAITGLLL